MIERYSQRKAAPLRIEKEKAGKSNLPADKTNKKRPKRRLSYSNFSVITGNCSLALANDFTTKPSASSEVMFLAVAISLTSRYLARSSASAGHGQRYHLGGCFPKR